MVRPPAARGRASETLPPNAGDPRAGRFHVFDPTTQTWFADPMLAVSVEQAQVGTVAFHALDYDPVDNVYVFLADGPSGRQTWAYRWRG